MGCGRILGLPLLMTPEMERIGHLTWIFFAGACLECMALELDFLRNGECGVRGWKSCIDGGV